MGCLGRRVRLRRILVLKSLQSQGKQERRETGHAATAILRPEGHASMLFISKDLFDPHSFL